MMNLPKLYATPHWTSESNSKPVQTSQNKAYRQTMSDIVLMKHNDNEGAFIKTPILNQEYMYPLEASLGVYTDISLSNACSRI
jgi:hypothetical protein